MTNFVIFVNNVTDGGAVLKKKRLRTAAEKDSVV